MLNDMIHATLQPQLEVADGLAPIWIQDIIINHHGDIGWSVLIMSINLKAGMYVVWHPGVVKYR